MKDEFTPVLRRFTWIVLLLGLLLFVAGILGISIGSSGNNLLELLPVLTGRDKLDPSQYAIIWQIRFPRVILAAVVGATLALGGLVFQALLRNPLAEPYILGISGGSAVGAIAGMLAGFKAFPGVSLSAFSGSMATLGLVLLLSARCSSHRDSILLGGVMMNAFCGAMIMFLIYLSQGPQIHHILFWLMGDLSTISIDRLPLLMAVLPCFFLIFLLARPMNLLLMGRETAAAMGVSIKKVILALLVTTSFMVSIVVCQSGLVGFVGLVIPHFFRLLVGPDHRLLVPACILGGATYLVLCDLLARTLPSAGEMPVGIITAMIGAPVFICLLWGIRR